MRPAIEGPREDSTILLYIQIQSTPGYPGRAHERRVMRNEVKNYISLAWRCFRWSAHGFRGFACSQFCTQTMCRQFLTGSGTFHPVGCGSEV